MRYIYMLSLDKNNLFIMEAPIFNNSVDNMYIQVILPGEICVKTLN